MHQVGKLIQGLTYEQYDEFGKSMNALRSSHLKELKRSPAHYRHSQLHPREETEALRQGKLIHTAFENPAKFLQTYVVEPVFQGKTKTGELTTSANCKEVKEKKAEWYANQPKDAVVIKQDEADMIVGMISSMAQHKLASRLLTSGIREVSGWIEDPQTGVMLQYRPDFIHDMGYIIDIKSTRNASVSSFTHDIFSERGFFYVLQAAHYTYCAKLMGHSKHDSFTFIAIEKEPPYGLNVIALSTHHLEVGEYWRKKLTKVYSDCMRTGTWPGYDERAVNPEIPMYVNTPIFNEDGE